MKRRRLHTSVLTAAGAYNLTWGGWIAVHPTDLYQAAGIPIPNHPEIAGVLGMVVALYGILYLHAATHPEHGWPIVAIGLLGKVIGPAALLWHTTTGAWPTSSLAIIIFNDLLWWAPFALYLHDAWPQLVSLRHRISLHTRPRHVPQHADHRAATQVSPCSRRGTARISRPDAGLPDELTEAS